MNIRKVRRTCITGGILAVCLTLSSCDNRPKGVLSDDKMADLITDMQIAEAYYASLPAGEKNADKKALEEAVLKKHGVNKAELDSTISYYGRNIDDYYKLYDKVEKKLRAMNAAGATEERINSDDIWPYARNAVIMPNQIREGITFSIPADNIEPGNQLEWGMRLTSADGVEIMMGVDYDNGTSTLFKKTANGNKSLQVNLQTDTALTATRIFGVLKVPERTMPVWTDSIRLIKTEYDSTSYSKIRMQRTIRKLNAKPEKKEETTGVENQDIEIENPAN